MTTRLALPSNALLTLVLTARMVPLKAYRWERAFSMAYKGKVDIVESYEAQVVSEGVSLELPSVVRVRRDDIPHVRRSPRFNRTNLLLRDGYRCGYCNELHPAKELTFDHVIPKAQWRGPIELRTHWGNIVAACWPCNQKKRDRTPKQAGMVLLRRLYQPDELPARAPYFPPLDPPASWLPYLPHLASLRRAA